MRSAAVLTISDSSCRGEREDRSGPAVTELLRDYGYESAYHEIVPDDQAAIEEALIRLSGQVVLIVTTGGTGIAARDVTPEATRAVCSKLVEGIAERMRSAGLSHTPYAVLSRGVCGVCGQALILNLPGHPNASLESLGAVIEILPHALDLLAGKTEHE